jgi:hypothetical protein
MASVAAQLAHALRLAAEAGRWDVVEPLAALLAKGLRASSIPEHRTVRVDILRTPDRGENASGVPLLESLQALCRRSDR